MRRMPSMTIPKYVRLPWRTIKVVQVTRAEMKVILGCKPDEDAADGCWDTDTDTISLVSDDVPMSRIRYTLYHEIGHAWHDVMDSLLDSWNISEREPRRGKKETNDGTGSAL